MAWRINTMHNISRNFLLAMTLAIAACGPRSDEPGTSESAMPDPLKKPFAALSAAPPVAEKRPVEIEQHGIKRVDNYGWMRDENWQEVLRDPGKLDAEIRQHLEAENTYYEKASGNLERLREQLFDEMRGRIKEADSTVPAADGDFAYAVRFRDGGEYPIFVRTPRNGAVSVRSKPAKSLRRRYRQPTALPSGLLIRNLFITSSATITSARSASSTISLVRTPPTICSSTKRPTIVSSSTSISRRAMNT
jgi:hypothetical protein